MNPRIFALTVGRNEADRYLAPMVAHHKQFVSGHFFYDDQSDDGTPGYAHEFGCTMAIRPHSVPSFDENEGAFRQAAWMAMEVAFNPAPSDWVLVVDCDEALINTAGNDSYWVPNLVGEINADAPECIAIDLNIPEVFGFNSEGVPLVRYDGMWGTIHAPRLVRYRPGGMFALGDMGVPAVPSYAMVPTRWYSHSGLALMHFGYADTADHQWKYERYSGRTGHSNAHVESIIATDKQLVPWPHHYPEGMHK